jgi:hypothetical protein
MRAMTSSFAAADEEDTVVNGKVTSSLDQCLALFHGCCAAYFNVVVIFVRGMHGQTKKLCLTRSTLTT